MPDVVRKPPLLATPLHTSIVGSRVLVYEEVTSTNDRALQLRGHGIVVVADRQTAGRGRHGRSWASAPGLGLWFSIGFDGPCEGLAFAAPLSVRDVLNTYGYAAVKWPNDVLLNGKKVCGILLESRRNRTALGIGINVHHQAADFPEELHSKATSIELATGYCVDRGSLLRDVLTSLDARVVSLRDGRLDAIHAEWSEACGVVGRRVRYHDRVGTVRALDRDGALLVETDRGIERVLLGEIVELNGA